MTHCDFSGNHNNFPFMKGCRLIVMEFGRKRWSYVEEAEIVSSRGAFRPQMEVAIKPVTLCRHGRFLREAPLQTTKK